MSGSKARAPLRPGLPINRAVYASAWKTSAFGGRDEIIRMLKVWLDLGVPDHNLRLIQSYRFRAPAFVLENWPAA